VSVVDVRLVDVVKRFGNVIAVDHISLEVRAGEFFSLLGPSGCGKTTTLRMIGGFEEPMSGLIELQGRDVTRVPPNRRNVNTVFQNYALFPHLTIFENVAFALRRKKVGEEEIKQRVASMLDLVELQGLGHRRPNQISGGQAQRVALARALVNRPAVLLLDEPLGALDLKLRKQMQIELKRIQQDVGISFIYVTHDQEEAMSLSDRIAVMNRGRYEQLGTPEELYERPLTRFVAGFLGNSNLFDAMVVGTADEHAVAKLKDGTVIRIPQTGAAVGAAVSAGVRPEKVRLGPATEDAATTLNTLLATIRDVSYLGVGRSYVVETADGTRLTVVEQNVAPTSSAELPVPGMAIRLRWSPDHTFVVPADDAQA
jgi:spermidine/putrescine transport system ATP-binding protein